MKTFKIEGKTGKSAIVNEDEREGGACRK